MDCISERDGELHMEAVSLEAIARRFGTPCYVYSRAAILGAFASFDQPFGNRKHLICYAVKANSNLAILNLLARAGSGFDIVSGGELERVLLAGGDPGKVVFSGVGKSEAELRRALDAGILCFNVESEAELERLGHLAAGMGKRAGISLRVNPDVDARTHPYIATGLKESKFGIPVSQASALYRRAHRMAGIAVQGVDCHIGSQITEVGPFLDALHRVLRLVDSLVAEGIPVDHLDLGGGLGIRYRDEQAPAPAAYVQALLGQLGDRHQRILLEPGRSLVGNAGALLTRVEYLKPGPRNFAVVDAAMNDLIRPALYEAWHDIRPVSAAGAGGPGPRTYDVVGPVCESGDFLGQDRVLDIAQGDLLAILSAGAYGMSMSSNYNTRPRVAEVMVDGDQAYLVRVRETVAELMALESILP